MNTELKNNLKSFLDRLIKASQDGTIHPELFEADADTLRAAITLEAENTRLREVLATAQRDANRYRWLRIQDRDDLSFAVLEGAHWRGAGDCDPYFFDNSEELDAAIDAAMKEQP